MWLAADLRRAFGRRSAPTEVRQQPGRCDPVGSLAGDASGGVGSSSSLTNHLVNQPPGRSPVVPAPVRIGGWWRWPWRPVLSRAASRLRRELRVAVRGVALLRAGRHRPCQPQGAGQHDPEVHHLAQQPCLRRTAPPHRRQGKRSLMRALACPSMPHRRRAKFLYGFRRPHGAARAANAASLSVAASCQPVPVTFSD